MLALTKKHLTKISIGSKEFQIPKKEAQAILSLVTTIENSLKQTITADVVYKEIAKNRPKGAIYLRGIRVREDLSQVELSKLSGIAVSNISKFENGSRKISETAAKKLAKALEVDFERFLT